MVRLELGNPRGPEFKPAEVRKYLGLPTLQLKFLALLPEKFWAAKEIFLAARKISGSTDFFYFLFFGFPFEST